MEAQGFDEGAQEDDVGTLGIAQVGGDFRRIEVPDGDVFLQFCNDALGILAGSGKDGQDGICVVLTTILPSFLRKRA